MYRDTKLIASLLPIFIIVIFLNDFVLKGKLFSNITTILELVFICISIVTLNRKKIKMSYQISQFNYSIVPISCLVIIVFSANISPLNEFFFTNVLNFVTYKQSNVFVFIKDFNILHKVYSLSWVMLLGPFMEEMLFRYFIFHKLRKSINSLNTILLVASMFGVLHNRLFIATFFISLVMSLLYIRTKKIIYPILLHILYNSIAVLGDYLIYNTSLVVDSGMYTSFGYINILISLFLVAAITLYIIKNKKVINSEDEYDNSTNYNLW